MAAAAFDMVQIHRFVNLSNRACNEAIVDVAGCINCGAKPGEYCIGQYGHRTYSMHCARRLEAQNWRKYHPEEWKAIKDEIFQRLVHQTQQ